jgi:hypothetical protein
VGNGLAIAQNLLERREFKFLVPESIAQDIATAARSVCELDSHAGPDGSYAIRSLYFDNMNRDLFWANEREQDDRFKARVRCYPTDDQKMGDFAWLEIKRRVLDMIVKTRVSVPMENWVEVVRSVTGLRQVDWMPGRKKLGARFVRKVHTHHLEPTILVEYDREAYVSTVDEYARLTLDRHVRCQLQDRYSLEAIAGRWRAVDHSARTLTVEPMCIVECKFGALIPRWMMVLVQRFELLRYSFSKYCYSLESQLTLPRAHVAGIQSRLG